MIKLRRSEKNKELMINQQSFDNKELTLKKFLPQLTPSRLLLSSSVFGIFGVLTIAWIILTWRYNLDVFEVTYQYQGLERLLSGGTIRSLAIEGGQWWRILSYGLAMNGYGVLINAIVFLTLGLVFWKMLKFNEAISGPFRTGAAFIGAYVLNGFALSALGGPFIYGGFFTLTPIVVGMVVGTVNSHKNQVFDFMRWKLIWPFFLLIFLPLFTSAGDWISSAFGFVIGMAIMNLVYFRANRSRWTISFSIFALVLIFGLSLIFVLMPLPYGLAEDQVVRQMFLVQSYHHLGLTRDGANAILNRLNWAELPDFDKSFGLLFFRF